MPRLFLALELPEELRGKLADLNPHIAGLRWSPINQFHLTLAFLGQTSPESEDWLRHDLNTLRGIPFALTLQGAGTFGGRHPSILWAGINHDPALMTLQQQIADTAMRHDFTAASKPFHPHVTLGRPHGLSHAKLEPFLQEHANETFGMWEVREFKLFASELTPAGAIHTVRQVWQLGA